MPRWPRENSIGPDKKRPDVLAAGEKSQRAYLAAYRPCSGLIRSLQALAERPSRQCNPRLRSAQQESAAVSAGRHASKIARKVNKHKSALETGDYRVYLVPVIGGPTRILFALCEI